MSFKNFEDLSKKMQKKVLKRLFKRYGMMYTVNTKTSFNELKNEYNEYESVKNGLDCAMRDLGVI